MSEIRKEAPYTEAGQFDIERAMLLTTDGSEIDLLHSVVEISLYEDIHSNSLTGQLVIQTDIGLSNTGPIIGQEYLSLIISTPTLSDEKHKLFFNENVFHVIEVSKTNVQQNIEVLILTLITSEIVWNNRARVSKVLKGTYDEMVSSLLRGECKSKKDLYIEKTSNQKKLIAPNIRPFDLITLFSNQSISITNGTSSFLFFENFRGYHFRTLESLYAEGSRFEYHEQVPGASPEEKPGLSKKAIETKINNDLKTVLTYKIEDNKNSLINQALGGFSSSLIAHDIVYKKYSSSGYNYLESRKIGAPGDEKHINKYQKITDFAIFSESPVDMSGSKISDFTGPQYLSATTTIKNKDDVYKNSQFETYSDKEIRWPYEPVKTGSWLHTRRSYMENIKSGYRIMAEVNGNTTVGAGDIITINLNSRQASKSDTDDVDTFYRGGFLVETIKHTFNVSDRRHEMMMTLSKDSVEFPLSSGGKPEPKPKLPGRKFSDKDFYGGKEGYDEKGGPI